MPSRGDAALADAIVRGYLHLRSGATVTIEAWSHALPLARALVVAARRRGAEPVLVLEDEEAFFQSLGPRDAAIPVSAAALGGLGDAYVYLPGPEQFPRLFGLRWAELAAVGGRHSRRWRQIADRRGLTALRLAIADATPTAAERYGVDVDEWREEIRAATLVPPRQLTRSADEILRRLRTSGILRIRHSNGTDLRVDLRARSPVVEDGTRRRSSSTAWIDVPAGVVRVPVATGTGDGVWESNRQVYDRWSEPPVAVGASFRFRAGRMREVTFDRGGAGFAAGYALGGAGRGAPSSITFGLNPRVVNAPEVGHLAHGTVGLGIGNNERSGGRNRARFAYWTGLTGAEFELDGRPWAYPSRPRT